jgi:hypothetical protein
MNDLSLTILIWDDIINKIINKALIEKVNKISPMLSEDATERYRNFFTKFPTLANRILIFSFLSRHHTIFVEPDKKKYSLKFFFAKWQMISFYNEPFLHR